MQDAVACDGSRMHPFRSVEDALASSLACDGCEVLLLQPSPYLIVSRLEVEG